MEKYSLQSLECSFLTIIEIIESFINTVLMNIGHRIAVTGVTVTNHYKRYMWERFWY